MNSNKLFSLALGLQEPWEITSVEFSSEDENLQLHLTVGFPAGSTFPDAYGNPCSVYDKVPRQWQRLNFFQHQSFLHCDVPRILTQEGKVTTVVVPWARSGSGFTLMFEAFSLALIERVLKVYPKRIWTIFNHWTRITNGMLEGINSKVQLAKRRARGYRNINNSLKSASHFFLI